MTNRRDTNKRTKGPSGLQIPPIYEQTIDINGDEDDGDYSMEWVTPAIGSVYHPNHQRLFNGAERRRSVSFQVQKLLKFFEQIIGREPLNKITSPMRPIRPPSHSHHHSHQVVSEQNSAPVNGYKARIKHFRFL